MMVSSTFTLEYTIEEESEALVKLSTPRDQVPEQLKKLGIAESEWCELWDKVQGVAGRAAQREVAKKQLDEIISEKKKTSTWGFGGKSKEKVKKSEEELKKEAYDKDTEKGWNNVVNKANKMWEGHGVFARKIVDVRTSQVFGVEFECDVAKLQSDKVVLRYDFRREALTLPRKEVPKELASLGMDLSSWSRIWDMTQTAMERAHAQENEKKKIKNRMKNMHVNLVYRGEMGDELEVKKYVTFMTKSLEDQVVGDKAVERAWKILENKVQDVCLSLGVIASLLVHDLEMHGGVEAGMYSGLELRVIPSNTGGK